ncbi:MAG: hypothetical protein GEU99_19025 [Luteitalea sp.]|nr:hypothetical protein [Luteitalea sp.]
MRSRLSPAVVSAWLWLAPAMVAAQSSLAVLRGTVSDPSGALIPGVSMTLTEPVTGVTVRDVASDQNGNYEIPDLKPGTYRLKAEIQGFKTFLSDNLLLESGQTRRIDVPLELGAIGEEVTVVAGAQLLTTDTGTISGRFSKDQFQKAPLVDLYPSPLGVFTTLPGVQGGAGGGWELRIAGQSTLQFSQAMDGIASRTQDQTNNMNFQEEANVITVNAPPESSRLVFQNLTSKRGQSAFHGMAYYKYFGSGLNARTFFESDKTPFVQHEWQLEAGGPIVPKKTFFYGAWMSTRIPKGSFNLASVPTQKMREGDFSQFSAAVIDPLTGDPFPSNRVPRDRMSPVSLATQDRYYPTPNRGDENTLSDNFEWVHPYSSDFYYTGDWPFVRIDHNVTDSNSLYARWTQRHTPYVLVTNLPQFFWTRLRDHRRLVLADTHVFSSAMVNTFRFGFNHDILEDGVETDGQQPINGAEAVSAIGLQEVNAQGHDMAGFPAMYITGLSSLETVTGGLKNNDKDFAIEESLTWTIGRHVWKLGAQYQTFELSEGVVPSYGSFTFNGVFTGHAYADFLLGIPFESSRYDPRARRRTSSELGLYAQDSFKVGPNLTIDYGLRWDYFTSTHYKDGLMYNWDKSTGAVVVPDVAHSALSPLYPDTISITSGDVIPTPDQGNVRPRVSAAYRFNDHTVLRGGYGSFTQRLDYFARAEGGGPFQISETYLNLVNPGSPPLFAFPSPFPESLASAQVPSQSINNAYPMETDNGTIHQFNVSFERELWHIGFRVSYIGSRGVGLNYQWVNINKPEPSLIPFTTDRRPWPQFVEVFEVREDGKEKYDALQLEGRRRAGLVTFDAHYTWSRNLSNYANLENPYDVTSHWSNDDVTRRHFAAISTEWTLPIGREMKYLRDASPIVDRLLGGWSIATVSYFASGNFFSPWFSGADPSNTGTFGGVPDRLGPGNLPADERTPERWFTPADFVVPTAGRLGNAAFNSLEGQGLNVHHVSLSKRTALARSASLTFTVTASNVFNHPHFVAPNADITTPGVGRVSAVMNDFSPEKAGRRMVMLKGSVAF